MSSTCFAFLMQHQDWSIRLHAANWMPVLRCIVMFAQNVQVRQHAAATYFQFAVFRHDYFLESRLSRPPRFTTLRLVGVERQPKPVARPVAATAGGSANAGCRTSNTARP